MDATIQIKLRNDDSLPFFGPGTAELLELIAETGSVRHASERMALSYSKAWKMIRGIEEATGKEAVTRVQGGRGGGRAELTEAGKSLLCAFRAIERDMRMHLEAIKGDYLGKAL